LAVVGKLLTQAHDCGGQQVPKKDLKEKEKTQTEEKKKTTTSQEETGKKKDKKLAKKPKKAYSAQSLLSVTSVNHLDN
jgi:hypothetical protein